MKTALLISTYNWPEALELVLNSALQQSRLPDEILIADDGSTEATKSLIRSFQKKGAVPINHIWHKDNGFRKSIILNKTIASSNSDYIIQIDGDCILHPNFIADHLKNARKEIFLFGSRVNLNIELSEKILQNKQIEFGFFQKGIRKRSRNIYLPQIGELYKPKNELSKKVRGCNISYWRNDILIINGFNEDMVGWGREDSELVVRLLNNGVYGKRMRYQAIIYHIWHPQAERDRDIVNFEIQLESEKKELLSCSNGINKYLL